MNAEGARAADQLWLLPTPGQNRVGPIAEVAVHARSYRTHRYAVPPALAAEAAAGALVRVPYGRRGRVVEGTCSSISVARWDQTLRPLLEVCSGEPTLNKTLIELGLWVSEYYAFAPGLTLRALTPAVVRKYAGRRVKFVRLLRSPADERITDRQRVLLAALASGPLRRSEGLKQAGVSASTLASLRKRGLVEVFERVVEDEFATHTGGAAPDAADAFSLTDGQRAALAAISEQLTPSRFGVSLLFGIPGSGKTEVYVRAIRAAVALGRQAILTVPEIALATQVMTRLARRFERVAVLHSGLSDRDRARAWRAIAAGKVDVVIGTRTAVFAPCRSLGLIVVDEEQESSYKNLAAPYYHARDVAIKRAQLEGLPVVLGSATPALETWHNAQTLAHYNLLRLPERVPGAQLPRVRVVEQEPRNLGETDSVLAPALRAALERTLADGRQAVLLQNRRGYATHLYCEQCGLRARCTRCGIDLVLHESQRQLRCHRCGRTSDIPQTCLDNSCGGRLIRAGYAIERLERELRSRFPKARLQRLDSDTMRRRSDYEQALRRFERREADILLGTQMVAKGLDFPGVGLVGAVDADALLSMPDFRAAERAFQLLMQVVGRAGRARGESLAIVQVRDESAAWLRHAVRMDYESFAAEELVMRRETFDPPRSRLIRLLCADRDGRRARSAAEQVCMALRSIAGRTHAGIRVDDPSACAMARVRGLSRWEVLVRVPRGERAGALLRTALEEKLLSPRVARLTVDVDPLDLA